MNLYEKHRQPPGTYQVKVEVKYTEHLIYGQRLDGNKTNVIYHIFEKVYNLKIKRN